MCASIRVQTEMSGSVYETWVRGIRAWEKDPTTNLDHMPSLDESSLPPATFERLATHIMKALQTFTDQWVDQLASRLSKAKDPFQRARIMVDCKRLFARRLLLAQHPGFPATLRDALWQGACADVGVIQDSLEKAGSDGDKHPGATGHNAAFFRDHSLRQLVVAGFPLSEFIAGTHEISTPVQPINPSPIEPSNVALGISQRVIPQW